VNTLFGPVGRRRDERADDVELRERRHLYNGFGNALSRAFELVVTPLLFALAGFGLDRLAGTGPLFVLLLGGFGLVGIVARSWYQYAAEMDAHAAALPGAGRSSEVPTSATRSVAS
jgi:F0F1-type ATP synthase assembly protein I